MCLDAVGSTSSGRARSDPTHHHHGHHHAHVNTARYHEQIAVGNSMDCDSPPASCAGSRQCWYRAGAPGPPPAHQASQSRGTVAWDEGHSNDSGGGCFHSTQHFSTHRLHHHHHGGYISGPLATVQSSATSLSSTSSSSSSALPGPHAMGLPPFSDLTHPHPQRPGPAADGDPVDVTANSIPVDLSTLHCSAAGGGGRVDPQLDFLNVHLGRYSTDSRHNQFSQHGHWPAVNTATPGGHAHFHSNHADQAAVPQPLVRSLHDGPAPIRRTAAAVDRGDDSPMIGVCVQQSPVASH